MLSFEDFVLCIYCKHKSLSYVIWKYFFPLYNLSFHSLNSFPRVEVFNFDEIHLISTLRIVSVLPRVQRWFPMTCCRSFIVLHLSVWSILTVRFRSQCVPHSPLWASNCSNTVYWKSDPSSIDCFCFFDKNQLCILMWLYLWVLYFTPLIPVFIPG